MKQHDNKPIPTPGQFTDDSIPSIVDGILVFFYLVVWLDVLLVSLPILNAAQGNILRFVPPLFVYVCLLLSFPVRNWRRFRRGEGKMSDLLWGYQDQFAHRLVFVLLNFAIIIWLSALNDNFVYLYFMLLGVSAGLLQGRGKLMWIIVSVEIVVFALQAGVWDELQKTNYNIFNPDVAGFALGMGLFIAYVVMFSLLITSRVKSEALVVELKATKAQLEEALQKEKEVAVLRERDRMAREMHDVLGHALVLVAVKIEAAQRLQPVDPDRAAAELESTKELVRQSMADLRTSLADLRSPDLEAGSKPLSQALEEWATRTAAEGNFSIRFNIQAEADTLLIPVQDALWRVGREAVLNVVKHARAHNAELNLFIRGGEAYLTVTDDGVGIPHLAEGQARLEVEGHYGLRGMRERVEALGGHLSITPGRDGRGTMLVATVPLPADDRPSATGDLPAEGTAGATGSLVASGSTEPQ